MTTPKSISLDAKSKDGSQSGTSFPERVFLGYIVAPVCGQLLFVGCLLLLDFIKSTVFPSLEVQYAAVFTLTLGLFASYVLSGVLGLPTVFALQRFSVLNFATLSLAAMGWFIVVLAGIRLTDGSPATMLLQGHVITGLGTLAFLVAPQVLFMNLIFTRIVLGGPTFQVKLTSLLSLMAIVAMTLTSTSIVYAAIQKRVVVCAQHPNGARLLIAQEFDGEPFSTSIYYDDGSGTWLWYYYEHEDLYWGSAEATLNQDEICVHSLNSNGRSVVLNTKTGECTRVRVDGYTKTTAKSTRAKSPPFSAAEIIAKTESL